MPDSIPAKGRRGLFVAAIVIPLALLAGLGILTHMASEHLVRERESLHRLAALKSQTSSLLTAMVDQETGQRGYILAQNPAFLEPYDGALQVLPSLRQTLALSMPDSAGHELQAALEKSIDARLAFAEQSIALQRRGDHDGAVALVTTGQGKVLMDRVRADIAALQSRFDESMKTAEEQFSGVVRTNEIISWGIVALDGLFVTLLLFLLLRLRRAERFLNVCAWSKAVEYQGEWISFEAYLSRRFGISTSHGISPQEAQKMVEALHSELPAPPSFRAP